MAFRYQVTGIERKIAELVADPNFSKLQVWSDGDCRIKRLMKLWDGSAKSDEDGKAIATAVNSQISLLIKTEKNTTRKYDDLHDIFKAIYERRPCIFQICDHIVEAGFGRAALNAVLSQVPHKQLIDDEASRLGYWTIYANWEQARGILLPDSSLKQSKAADLGIPKLSNNETSETKQEKHGKDWARRQISNLIYDNTTKYLPLMSSGDCKIKRLVGIYKNSDMTDDSFDAIQQEINREITSLDYQDNANSKDTKENFFTKGYLALKYFQSSAVPKELVSAVQDELKKTALKMINYSHSSRYRLFEVSAPFKFSDNPKLIAFENGSFFLDAIPNNFSYAQQQLDLVYKFIKKRENAENYLSYLQTGIDKLYGMVGLQGEGYKLTKDDMIKALDNFGHLMGIKATSRYGGLYNYDTRNIDIDSVGAIQGPLLRHELGHAFQKHNETWKQERDWKKDVYLWMREGINGIINDWDYPELTESISKHLKSLNKTERKKVCDALVKENFGVATSEETKIAENAIREAQKYVK